MKNGKKLLCLLLALMLTLGLFAGCSAESPDDDDDDRDDDKETTEATEDKDPSGNIFQTEPTETEPPATEAPVLRVDPFENAYYYRNCTYGGQWPKFEYEAWSYYTAADGTIIPLELVIGDDDIIYQEGDTIHMSLENPDMTEEDMVQYYGVIFTRTEADIICGDVDGWNSDGYDTDSRTTRLAFTQENFQKIVNQLGQPGWRKRAMEDEPYKYTNMEETGFDQFDKVIKNLRIQDKLPASYERLGVIWRGFDNNSGLRGTDVYVFYAVTGADGVVRYASVDAAIEAVPQRLKDGTLAMISAFSVNEYYALSELYPTLESLYQEELQHRESCQYIMTPELAALLGVE